MGTQTIELKMAISFSLALGYLLFPFSVSLCSSYGQAWVLFRLTESLSVIDFISNYVAADF